MSDDGSTRPVRSQDDRLNSFEFRVSRLVSRGLRSRLNTRRFLNMGGTRNSELETRNSNYARQL
jgi:hypothetical protein